MAGETEDWPLDGTEPVNGLPGPDDVVTVDKNGRRIQRGAGAKTHPFGSLNPEREKNLDEHRKRQAGRPPVA